MVLARSPTRLDRGLVGGLVDSVSTWSQLAPKARWRE